MVTVTTRHLGIGIIVLFLLNIGLLYYGASIGPFPVGVYGNLNASNLDLSYLNLQNGEFPAYLFNATQDQITAFFKDVKVSAGTAMQREAPGVNINRVVQVFYQSGRGDNYAVENRAPLESSGASGGAVFNEMVPATPKDLVGFIQGGGVWSPSIAQQLCGGCSLQDAISRITASTQFASQVAEATGFGFPINQQGKIVGVQPYGAFWDPGYVATAAQAFANRGYTQLEIYAGLVGMGFDAGFAGQVLTRINAFAGTSYSATGQGDLDTKVYGTSPFSFHFTDPTYFYSTEGTIQFVSGSDLQTYTTNVQKGTAFFSANCAGGIGCLEGGGTHYLSVPTDIANDIGTAKLLFAQGVINGILMGLPMATDVAAGNAFDPNCHKGCTGFITLKQYDDAIDIMNQLGTKLMAYQKATGYAVTSSSGVPYESGIPSAFQASAFPSPYDAVFDTFMYADPVALKQVGAIAAANNANPLGGLTKDTNNVVAQRLAGWMSNYGWTMGFDCSTCNTFNTMSPNWGSYVAFLLNNGFTKTQTDVMTQNALNAAKLLQTPGPDATQAEIDAHNSAVGGILGDALSTEILSGILHKSDPGGSPWDPTPGTPVGTELTQILDMTYEQFFGSIGVGGVGMGGPGTPWNDIQQYPGSNSGNPLFDQLKQNGYGLSLRNGGSVAWDSFQVELGNKLTAAGYALTARQENVVQQANDRLKNNGYTGRLYGENPTDYEVRIDKLRTKEGFPVKAWIVLTSGVVRTSLPFAPASTATPTGGDVSPLTLQASSGRLPVIDLLGSTNTNLKFPATLQLGSLVISLYWIAAVLVAFSLVVVNRRLR